MNNAEWPLNFCVVRFVEGTAPKYLLTSFNRSITRGLKPLFRKTFHNFLENRLSKMKLLVSVSPRHCCMNVHVFSGTETQTIEEGGNVNLTCGDSNHSSTTVLSWSKDGEDVLVNITSFNQSMLVLSNLERSSSGLYVCTANSSVVLRRVRLTVTKGEK